MANIFKLTKDYVNPPKRNSYDLSYQNDFTAKFGTLYPIFIKEVNPGDSFSIRTTLGVRAEPMVFPVQSKIRADVHYFYVRNRTLWENWMDFIGKVDDTIEHPYINRPISDFKTKSLYDYLGVPTSVTTDSVSSGYYSVNPWNIFNTRQDTSNSIVDFLRAEVTNVNINNPLIPKFNKLDTDLSSVNSLPFYFIDYFTVGSSLFSNIARTLQENYRRLGFALSPVSIDLLNVEQLSSDFTDVTFTFPTGYLDSYITNPVDNSAIVVFFLMKSSQNNLSIYSREIYYSGYYLRTAGTGSNIYVPIVKDVRGSLLLNGHIFKSNGSYSDLINTEYDTVLPIVVFNDKSGYYNSLISGSSGLGGYYSLQPIKIPTNSDSSILPYLPWCGSNRPIKLSALPFRAYEAIYNSYYRNYMNNPFMLDGKPQYNRYVTNLSDGSDSTPYKLFNRNWELDFLTSAQQSPQQGEAPLVGITVNPNSTATMKFKSSELESAGVANGEVTATVEIDENTNVLGISYYDEQLPQSNLKRLMDAINYGISINDLRQTTALQRWLEKNIMRGYRYIDQIKSHFGVDVSYRDLLMPEFIGGHSQTINTLTISQTTPTPDEPLGSYGGQAISKSSSENTVTKYCDEAGFIIGIMSIVPTPVYSQVPQQFFYKRGVLDYYFPEFGSIGMQPIFNKDITPLQVSPTQLEDVFGYQRPWWHLISSIDEVHGEFRTNRQGYLIQRLFAETPVLNGDFLTINNDAINNVFYVDDEQSDQFLCQAYFNVTKKTAIPLFGVPAIENADVN